LKDGSALSSHWVGKVAHYFERKASAYVTGSLKHDAPQLAKQAVSQDVRPARGQRLLVERDAHRQTETALGDSGVAILLGMLTVFHDRLLLAHSLSLFPMRDFIYAAGAGGLDLLFFAVAFFALAVAGLVFAGSAFDCAFLVAGFDIWTFAFLSLAQRAFAAALIFALASSEISRRFCGVAASRSWLADR
jgi:hypothetical protein